VLFIDVLQSTTDGVGRMSFLFGLLGAGGTRRKQRSPSRGQHGKFGGVVIFFRRLPRSSAEIAGGPAKNCKLCGGGRAKEITKNHG